MPKQIASHKKCSKCQLLKPRSEFWLRNKAQTVLHSRCIDCLKSASKMYKIRPKVQIGEKFCPRCKSVLPSVMFRRDSTRKDGLAGYCKPCNTTYNTEWSEANSEKDRSSKAKYRNSEHGKAARSSYSREFYFSKDGKKRQREQKLQREYGLTVGRYEAMLAEQNGRCAICGDEPNGVELCVDHCHKTGKIRGLLCKRCNSGLGLLDDDPHRLLLGIEYLNKYS